MNIAATISSACKLSWSALAVLAFAQIAKANPKVIVNSVPGQEIAIQATLSGGDGNGDVTIFVTISNQGGKTFLYSDDRVFSGVRIDLVYPDGSRYASGSSREGNYKLNILKPGAKLTRSIFISGHSHTSPAMPHPWNEAVEIQVGWYPPDIFEFKEQALRAAESSGSELLVYAAKKGLLEVSERLTLTSSGMTTKPVSKKESQSNVRSPVLSAENAEPTIVEDRERESPAPWSLLALVFALVGVLLFLFFNRRQ